ncbi:hypothetical protein EIJ50_22375, partial [Xanthomonas perforans]
MQALIASVRTRRSLRSPAARRARPSPRTTAADSGSGGLRGNSAAGSRAHRRCWIARPRRPCVAWEGIAGWRQFRASKYVKRSDGEGAG